MRSHLLRSIILLVFLLLLPYERGEAFPQGWSITERFSKLNEIPNPPQVVRDSKDILHSINLSEQGLLYVKLNRRGEILAEANLNLPSKPSLVMLNIDGEDMLHLILEEGDRGNYQVYYVKLDSEANMLSPPRLLPLALSSPLDIDSVVDDKGILHLVWIEKENSLYHLRISKEVIGDKQEIYYSEKRLGVPRLAVNNNGELAITWKEIELLKSTFYFSGIKRDGKLTGEPLKIGSSLSDFMPNRPYIEDTGASLAFDSKGYAHIVWTKILRQAGFGRAAIDIYYTRLSPQGEITYEEVLTPDRFEVEHPNIAIDARDKVYVVWQAKGRGGGEIMSASFSSDSQEMAQEERLTMDFSYSIKPSFVIDSFNKLHLFWYERTTQDTYRLAYKNTVSPQPRFMSFMESLNTYDYGRGVLDQFIQLAVNLLMSLIYGAFLFAPNILVLLVIWGIYTLLLKTPFGRIPSKIKIAFIVVFLAIIFSVLRFEISKLNYPQFSVLLQGIGFLIAVILALAVMKRANFEFTSSIGFLIYCGLGTYLISVLLIYPYVAQISLPPI